MGQYYYPVNVDKKQYINPHKFGDGLKLLEFGASACGTMTALAILLADGNGRGGGDLHSEHPIIGSWAGDRIVIAGDYADAEKFLTDDEIDQVEKKQQRSEINLNSAAHEIYEDISEQVITAMADDSYLKSELKQRDVSLKPDMVLTRKEGEDV